MDSDQGKLFIGGISWETSEEKLKEYFQGYGDVLQTVVMRDKITGKPKCFGFVVFADPKILDRVLQDTHVIDGRTEKLKEYFQGYGDVLQTVVMRDKITGKPKGFGFVVFADPKILDRVLQDTHVIDGRTEKLKEYFQGYGDVLQTVVMRDKITGKPKGFGFVVFADPKILDRVLQDTHVIDGRTREKTVDSDQGKLFIGGISWQTLEEKLKEYFQGYGDVLRTVAMRDKITGKPRGFGFVVFADPNILDRVLQDTHVIDGRTVEAKRALSREEQQQGPKSGNMSSGRSFGGGGGNNRTKKIFVGGLPPTLTEDGFRTYFEIYGNITDVAIMYDQQTNRPRGFGFISFDSEDAVDRVLHKTYHDLSGKQVEVKRALPKDSNSGFGGRSTGDNLGSYDRMDTNRYIQSQNTGGGGYPPYGSSGYGGAQPGYGYGSSNNGMGYGGYGSYGGAMNPGYGGPAVAAFGNPNVPAGGPKSLWGSQVPSGYGNLGYGGGGGPDNGGSAAGQSQTGAMGYGNQGYGGYSGSDSAYGGGASGDVQSGAGVYMGSGYGGASGNSSYGNSQGSGNYGAQQSGGQVGYGGAPSRHA